MATVDRSLIISLLRHAVWRIKLTIELLQEINQPFQWSMYEIE